MDIRDLPHEPAPTDEERLLDLLVDGELDEARRRHVLAWCHRQPDGWRRCATAFLEAQSWHQELGALRREPARQPEVPAAVAIPILRTPGSRKLVRWLGPICMAASFFLAFYLGLAWRGWQQQPGNVGDGAFSQPELADADPLGKQPDLPRAGQEPTPVGRPRDPLTNVRLVVDGPQGASQAFDLPVVEGRTFDDLWRHPGAMPSEVEEALERMGHQVLKRRQLVPVELQDGRRLIVPIDQIEIHPVANESFQ